MISSSSVESWTRLASRLAILFSRTSSRLARIASSNSCWLGQAGQLECCYVCAVYPQPEWPIRLHHMIDTDCFVLHNEYINRIQHSKMVNKQLSPLHS